jgi:hypothetical protein
LSRFGDDPQINSQWPSERAKEGRGLEHGYLAKDQDLQKAIADTLMALADSGVTDLQELRRRTLEKFDFKPPH